MFFCSYIIIHLIVLHVNLGHFFSQAILPIIDYADIVYQNTSDTYLKPLNVVYNSLCRLVLRCPYRTHHCHMYEKLNWFHPKSRRQFHWVLFILKCVHYDCPSYLKQYLIPHRSSYSLRHLQFPFIFVPRIFSEAERRYFQYKVLVLPIVIIFPNLWDLLLPFIALSDFYFLILN